MLQVFWFFLFLINWRQDLAPAKSLQLISFCDTCFIMVVWNKPAIFSRYALILSDKSRTRKIIKRNSNFVLLKDVLYINYWPWERLCKNDSLWLIGFKFLTSLAVIVGKGVSLYAAFRAQTELPSTCTAQLAEPTLIKKLLVLFFNLSQPIRSA